MCISAYIVYILTRWIQYDIKKIYFRLYINTWYVCIYIYIIHIYVYFFRRTILIHHWILYEWCVQWPTWRFNRSVFHPVPDVGHSWDVLGSPTFVSIHGMFEGFWDQQHDLCRIYAFCFVSHGKISRDRWIFPSAQWLGGLDFPRKSEAGWG